MSSGAGLSSWDMNRCFQMIAGFALALFLFTFPPASGAVAAAAKDSDSRIALESAKANLFFDQVFDEAADRSPQFLAQLGIKKDTDKWDDISEARQLENLVLKMQRLAELKRTIRYEWLDAQTQVSHRMFVRETEHAIEGWKWRHHNYPLNQMNGIHSEAPAFLINYHPIADVADAQAYLTRLRGLEVLFDQLLDGVNVRATLQIVPPRFVFPLVMDSIREIISGQPFDNSEKKSALLDDFETKVNALKNIEPTQKQELLMSARAVLTGKVKPAYEKIIAVLEAQQKNATEDDGVWKLPDGGSYYAYALRSETTTRLSAEEIHELGLNEVARIQREMGAIMAKVGFKGDLPAFFKFIKEDPQFYFPTTPEGKAAYIKRATETIETMRRRMDEFFITQPKAPLIIKPVEPFREQGAAGASLEQATPDGSKPGIYYVNTVDMRGLPIFEIETLAHHEAIPGHHLQISIAQELTGIPKFRKFGGNNAYSEGWALYSEYFPKEFGFYSDPYQDFGRLNDELLRAVRLVVDTGIHARRWTRQQVIDYFRKNTPNSERDILTETNRYIVWPGQATSYKIGMIQFIELRELSKKELGTAFQLREYHDLVLRCGGVPMDLLAENVRAWIKEKKK